MPIKAQYTVKAGDRISRIAANYQVTAQAIIDATPNVFTPERIAAGNLLIADNLLDPGEALFYTGEVLNIPTGRLDDISEVQTIRADSQDELTIQIDRKKCPLPHEFRFTEYFDACSDSFSITYPHDPETPNPAYKVDHTKFVSDGLPEIKIFIGEEPALTGSIEIPANKITPTASTQTLGGRSKTFLLEKSDPLPGIQKEFINLDIEQISEIVASAYGLEIELSTWVEVSEAFTKATMEDNEKPFTFLSRLARERSLIVTNSGTGKVLITKARETDPVANFVIDNGFLKFLGVESLEFIFDTTKLFGNYVGKAQTPDDQNLTSTVKSNVLLQQSVKVTAFEDADEKTLDSMTAWEEQKAVREFYKNSIPYPNWLNPNTGKRWKTGETITIQAPEAGIENPVELLIRQIEFIKSTGDKRTATLGFIPVGVYL